MDTKKKIKVAAAVAVVFLCGILYLAYGRGNDVEDVTETLAAGSGEELGESPLPPADGERESLQDGKSYIHIIGAVKKPGVYTFDEEPRVIDVVKAAGGFTKKADRASVNLAEKISDGCQLEILRKSRRTSEGQASNGQTSGGQASNGWSSRGQTSGGQASNGRSSGGQTSVGGGSAGSGDNSGKININSADKTELMQIPGIGEAKAAAIMAYREENGRFSSVEDIMKIPGIKEGIFSQIRDFITV